MNAQSWRRGAEERKGLGQGSQSGMGPAGALGLGGGGDGDRAKQSIRRCPFGGSLRAGGQAGQTLGVGGRAGAEGAETQVGDRQEDRQQDNTENKGVPRVGSPG